ncbi:putative Leucine-rich repeat protein kinase family protein [Cinnamomum micranthum f. kanehirae]|uniref:Putative Leucine-rich repeat protein kinase family protein n=1 Tax=Cinnamomum micranthum f. kanehirae TaxID=337451 RepID=A0A443PVX7_9MAGN|nr:putative Leucine-rich repeat protein kinase family protein [Cinnamomum micranthum f. kanehirae]
MERILFWVISISLVLLVHISKSNDEAEKQSLLDFFHQLNNGRHPTDPVFGWNSSSDPCSNHWKGITCNSQLSVKKVALEDLGLTGIFNTNSILCSEVP